MQRWFKVILPACFIAWPGVSQPASVWQPLGEVLLNDTMQPVMIYVQAAWCGPCRLLERETLRHADVQRALRGWILSKLAYDDHDRVHRVGPYRLSEADWVARLGVQTTPALVFLGPDGNILARKIGFVSPQRLTQLLSALIAAPPASDAR